MRPYQFFILPICFCLTATVGFADETAGLISNGLNTLDKLNHGHDTRQCNFDVSGSSFSSKDQFISYVCRAAGSEPIDSAIQDLKAHGGADAVSKYSSGEITFGDFADDLKAFLKNNSQIPKLFGNTSPSDWVLSHPSKSEQCRFMLASNRSTGAEMDFKKLSFDGISHLYEMNGPAAANLPSARKDLLTRLQNQNPDALIIEGFKFGQPLPCDLVLNSVFSSYEAAPQEWDILQKYGFLHQIPLVPGDNQRVEESDIHLFFGDNESKAESVKRDLQFIDILHSYYVGLLNNSAHPLEDALSQAESSNGGAIPFDSSSFKRRYRELNGRDLPSTADAIRQDFTPSVYMTDVRGTNRLADLQDDLRNQALLRAIQISTKNYSRPMVVFGSGHLGDVGIDLEKHLGAPTKIDFGTACPRASGSGQVKNCELYPGMCDSDRTDQRPQNICSQFAGICADKYVGDDSKRDQSRRSGSPMGHA